ncbi:Hypothetical protein NTJ_04852 [Nesidiocoris tenuis]|uniref:Uncharacterized protein n=1 Tax=Nesidiocoris tenuis TaxID=355587 RepID=A0ABN7AKU4_9HEMI|nr:Hypothetical protein NTJ_04852 [Nesidiocoris tenuis]
MEGIRGLRRSNGDLYSLEDRQQRLSGCGGLGWGLTGTSDSDREWPHPSPRRRSLTGCEPGRPTPKEPGRSEV